MVQHLRSDGIGWNGPSVSTHLPEKNTHPQNENPNLRPANCSVPTTRMEAAGRRSKGPLRMMRPGAAPPSAARNARGPGQPASRMGWEALALSDAQPPPALARRNCCKGPLNNFPSHKVVTGGGPGLFRTNRNDPVDLKAHSSSNRTSESLSSSAWEG